VRQRGQPDGSVRVATVGEWSSLRAEPFGLRVTFTLMSAALDDADAR
jgi:hypothetical protein